MALLMALDKSPSVPYAGRRLGRGGGGNYSDIRVPPDYFLLKWIIFKVCEHEYMNKFRFFGQFRLKFSKKFLDINNAQSSSVHAQFQQYAHTHALLLELRMRIT